MTRRVLAQRLVSTAFVALLGPMAAAQPARPPAQTAPPAPAAGSAQIAGVVKNSIDDTPVARARVSAVSDALPGPRVALTGPDGKYALADLPAGSYTVSVARSGFAPQTHATGRSIAPAPIVVAAGQQVVTDFALVPSAVIAGRILDEDGTPFAGAVVDALVTRSENGTDTLLSVSTSQTDDRGEFRLFGLVPGPYYLSASDPAFRSVSTPKGVQNYSPTYYPGVAFPDQARTVVVTGTGEPPRVGIPIEDRPSRSSLGPARRVRWQAAVQRRDHHEPGRWRRVRRWCRRRIRASCPTAPSASARWSPVIIRSAPAARPNAAGTALFAVYTLDVQGNDVTGVQMVLRRARPARRPARSSRAGEA